MIAPADADEPAVIGVLGPSKLVAGHAGAFQWCRMAMSGKE